MRAKALRLRPPHRQAFLAVQPLDPLVVDDDPLPGAAGRAGGDSRSADAARPTPGAEPAASVVLASLAADSGRWSGQRPPADRPGAGRTQTAPARSPRRPAAGRASPVFSEEFFERLVVERLLGDQPFKPGVLLLQRLQPFELVSFQAVVLCFPAVERLLADAMPPTQRPDRFACGVLLQDADDLLFRNRLLRIESSLGLSPRRTLIMRGPVFGGHVRFYIPLERDEDEVHRAIDDLGKAVTQVLQETGMNEEELIELLGLKK